MKNQPSNNRPSFGKSRILQGDAEEWIFTVQPFSPSSAFDLLSTLDLKNPLPDTTFLHSVGFLPNCPTGSDSLPPTLEQLTVFLIGRELPASFPPGIQFRLLQGREPRLIRLYGQFVGWVYEDEVGQWCVLNRITARNLTAPREIQARQIFEEMEQALESVGMHFGHVYRTWFYLDQIVEWYDRFNEIRNRFFEKHSLPFLPASTGIGTQTHLGVPIVGSLFAVRPKGQTLRLSPIASPLQCPAWIYGSAFNRAVEIEAPWGKLLFISGTASVGIDGTTLFPDQPGAQIEATLDVIEAILTSRNASWEQIIRGVAYLKRPKDLPLWQRLATRWGLPTERILLCQGEICRKDLLFELEVDVFLPSPSHERRNQSA